MGSAFRIVNRGRRACCATVAAGLFLVPAIAAPQPADLDGKSAISVRLPGPDLDRLRRAIRPHQCRVRVEEGEDGDPQEQGEHAGEHTPP